jgi:Zn-finger nucleic acid-binding protein
MKCPKCNGEFELINIDGTSVERCKTCKGLWFDILEAETLKKAKGAAILDVGELDLATEPEAAKELVCPKCQTKMTAMVNNLDPALTYEKCPVCYGVWFDAGAFRHYQQTGFLQTVKQFFSRMGSRQ